MAGLLSGGLALLPLLAALVAGILALRFRERAPRRTTIAAIGFFAMFVGGLPSAVLNMFIGSLVATGGFRAVSIAVGLLGVLHLLADLAGVGLLAYAVVSREPAAGPPAGPWQQQGPWPPPPQASPPGSPQAPWQQPGGPPYGQAPPPGEWPR